MIDRIVLKYLNEDIASLNVSLKKAEESLRDLNVRLGLEKDSKTRQDISNEKEAVGLRIQAIKKSISDANKTGNLNKHSETKV